MLNFAVKRHAFATAQRLDSGAGVVLYAADLQQGAVAKSAADLAAGSQLEFIKAFVTRLVPEGDSLLLVTETDVPPGSGLGGSGALGVAIVAALDRAYDRVRTPLETARLANTIERQDLGYPGGDQDSLGAALGGINFLEYHQGGGMTPRKVAAGTDTLRQLEYGSLLVYSGAAHVSASIHEDIKRSYAMENSPTVQAMIVLREQARAMATALQGGNLLEYASALSESCRQLYNLHESCGSTEHRRYLDTVDDCILGGKTCGAGAGGFILLFCKPGHRQECMRRSKQLGALVWPVTIDFDGVAAWQEPAFEAAQLEQFRHLAAAPS